jgi:hypothetical protein
VSSTSSTVDYAAKDASIFSGQGWDTQALIELRPKTPRELHSWIESYCRTPVDEPIKMPTKSVCRGHDAPFTFIWDQFIRRYSDVFLKANRSGMKTLGMSLSAFLEMFHWGLIPGHPLHVLDVGAIHEQGLKFMEYNQHLWQQPEFKDYLGRHAVLKESITLPGGTQMKVSTATMKAVNGPHVPSFYLDELELWEWPILQQAGSIPKAMGGHPARTISGSSQKFATGNVQEYLDDMPAKGWKIYTWCIWETIERCPPERECASCRIYEWPDDKGGTLCGGRAKHSDGYITVDEFIKTVDRLDRDTIEVEWLCLRPSRKGLVFGRDWIEIRHRVPVVIPYTPDLPLELSIDQGFTNPWAVLFIQEDEKHAQHRIIGELYETEHEADIMGRLTGNRLEALGVGNERAISCWVDPEDPGAAKIFAKNVVSDAGTRYKIITRRPKGRQDLTEYHRDVRIGLKIPRGARPRTLVSAGVKWLPWEMANYHYREQAEGRPISEKPVDKYNHAISAFYRWLSQFRTSGKARRGSDPRRR